VIAAFPKLLSTAGRELEQTKDRVISGDPMDRLEGRQTRYLSSPPGVACEQELPSRREERSDHECAIMVSVR
jgi:hypothetical protein